MIPSGRLTREVTIQQRAAGRDSLGQPNGGWGAVATVWAWFKAPSGSASAEHIGGGAEISETTFSARIRYRTGVTAGMRLLHGSTVYDIRQVIVDEARREYVDLVVTTGASEG